MCVMRDVVLLGVVVPYDSALFLADSVYGVRRGEMKIGGGVLLGRPSAAVLVWRVMRVQGARGCTREDRAVEGKRRRESNSIARSSVSRRAQDKRTRTRKPESACIFHQQHRFMHSASPPPAAPPLQPQPPLHPPHPPHPHSRCPRFPPHRC